MNKIKVVMHSKTVGYSGTDRTCQLFAKYLKNSEKYEPYIVYRNNDSSNQRLDIVKQWLGEDHVIGYDWTPGKKGRIPPYFPEQDNFADVLTKIDPQIVHCHYSGYNEWPVFKYLAPNAKWIGHNIFGFVEEDPQIDFSIYIADCIKEKAMKLGGKNGTVLYNPIEQPKLPMVSENKEYCRQKLLNQFSLPESVVLIGRVGRADNFDPISLQAFAEIEKDFPNTYYLVVNPCQNWRDVSKSLNIQNVRFLDPIIDDTELSDFYRGLDIYGHARSDGECCPCNIQEAMMHGLPVVSHYSPLYNGQAEILGNAGFVVPIGDHKAYADVLRSLIRNDKVSNDVGEMVPVRDYIGREARRRAMRYFEASTTTALLEGIYDWVLKNN